MAAAKYGKGLTGLIRRGWNEIPEILASSVLAAVGLGMGLYGAYISYRDSNHMKTYKWNYTVYREGDPKVDELRRYRKVD